MFALPCTVNFWLSIFCSVFSPSCDVNSRIAFALNGPMPVVVTVADDDDVDGEGLPTFPEDRLIPPIPTGAPVLDWGLDVEVGGSASVGVLPGEMSMSSICLESTSWTVGSEISCPVWRYYKWHHP